MAFVIRAKVPQGASGGPVVDRDGSLVGMIVGYDPDSPGRSIIVANSEIDAFLAANGVRLDDAPIPPRHPAVIERMLLDASALVQCVPGPQRRTGAIGRSARPGAR
jgi:hypothetical protein